jgi:hypothetical protein
MLAFLCITTMVLALLFCIGAFRAFSERPDLSNEDRYFKRRFLGHTMLLMLWCFGIQFLFLITFQAVLLIIPLHEDIASLIAWGSVIIYPLNVLIFLSGVWLGLRRGLAVPELLPYCRLPSLGLMIPLVVWGLVFLVWHVLY